MGCFEGPPWDVVRNILGMLCEGHPLGCYEGHPWDVVRNLLGMLCEGHPWDIIGGTSLACYVRDLLGML